MSTPRFWFELAVRYADTDAQGHVFFANYLTFFDEAFSAYLHAIGCPPKRLLELGVDVVYRNAQCDYVGRSHFEDRLQIGVRVARIGTTSFTTEYLIHKGNPDEPVASGQLTNVCVDQRTMTKVAVPPELRTALEDYRG